MSEQPKKKTALRFGIAVVVILLLAGSYLLLWRHIGNTMEQAQHDAAYAQFTLGDAVYEECDLSVVQMYAPEITEITKEICGTDAGKATFSDAEYPLCRLAALEDAGKKDGILLMEYGEKLRCYELTGFTALADAPSIADVCEAYEIGSAEDIVSVTIAEADGTKIDEMTEKADIAAFYDKLTALGDCLSEAEQAKAYYDAYEEKYGKTDDFTLEGATLTPNSDTAKEQGYALWGDGICIVGIRLANGLQICDMVYAPVPKLVTVFGCYRLETPFFS